MNSMENHSVWMELLGIAQNLLADGAQLLMTTEEGLPLDDTFVPYFMLRGHLKSISAVAGDVVILLKQSRYENIVGLARIGFESRVHVCATLARPGYAAEKVLAGIEEDIELIDEMLSSDTSPEAVQTLWLQTERSRLERIKEEYEGVRRRKWKFKEAAEAAGLASAYAARYSILSHAAHCTPKGIASKAHHAVVAQSVIRLVEDVCETIASLLFLEVPETGERRPAISNYQTVIPAFGSLHTRYCELELKSREAMKGFSFAE